MTNFTFSLAAGGTDFSELVSTAGSVTLLGMGAIFVVLSLLWACIEIMHRVVHRGENASKKDAQQAPATPATEASDDDPAIIAAITAAIAAEESAVVAAITAAITASLAQEGHTAGFRVVSFQRVDSAKKRRR